MSKIRETIVTNCEKKFLLKCLSDWTRLDGRSFDEFRPLHLKFGKDWGSCYVSLGKTRVLALTSCDIQQPKSSRPSEGILNVNIELNPLAASHFEPGRQSELSVQLNRLLEKCIKDSKAVDLESLCIKTNEKVWALRVDVNVINHEGNILDCASVAALASLAHFRRPDVTCDGEEFVIHTYQERDPIPTVIHHYPVCITYSIYNGGEFIIADPSLLEECASDATLTIGLNGFRELCGLHLGGKAELMPNVVLNTVTKATSRANIVIEEIKKAINIDYETRQKKLPFGYHIGIECLPSGKAATEVPLIQWSKPNKKKSKKTKQISSPQPPQVQVIGKGSAEYVPSENDTEKAWEIDDSEDDLMIVESSDVKIQCLDTDSEEDDVIMLDNNSEYLKSEK